MPRPANKCSLLDESKKSFNQLQELLDSLPDSEKVIPGVNGEWSVKDVLAHLYAWHNPMETWYIEGMAGNKPEMPAPSYTWKMTPQLNERIFQDHRDETFELVSGNIRGSYLKMQNMIEKHTNEELFSKKRYHWTGSTSLGCYLVSATSSHYHWATDLIQKWLKVKK